MNVLFLWVAFFVPVLHVGGACEYFLLETGFDACSDKGLVAIEDQSECNEAAIETNLRRPTHKQPEIEHINNWPRGCYAHTLSNNDLFLNLPHGGTSGKCSREAQCLCKSALCIQHTPVPPTFAPTAVPATSAPPTRPPETSVPATGAPPETLAPATSAPVPRRSVPTPPPTRAPATLVPLTLPPSTLAPITSAPSTTAPSTSAPITSAPSTTAPSTSAPTTSAPSTTAPSTSAPITSAPSTTAPSTSAPSTSEPITSAPSTLAPSTSAPSTTVPLSVAPSTASPSSNSPPSPAETVAPAVDVLDGPLPVQELDTAGTVAAGVGGMVGGSAASSASMLAVMLDGMCDGQEHKLSLALHPTRLVIEGSHAAGTVIGNLAIMLGTSLLMLILLHIAKKVPCMQQVSMLEIQGIMRFPSASLFVLLYLYQGTILSAFWLVFRSPGASYPLRGLGVTASLLLLAAPFVIAKKIRDNVDPWGPKGKAYYRADPQERGWLFTAIVGQGEWVSTRRRNHWVHRYQTMLRSFKQQYAWFIFGDFMAMALIGAASVASTGSWTRCGHVRMAMAAVNFLGLGVELRLRPHVRPRDTVFDCLRMLLQGVALVLMACGFYSEDPSHWGFAAAPPLFLAALTLVLLKLVLDFVTELYLLCTGRRARLQEAAWEDDAGEELEEFETDGEQDVHLEVATTRGEAFLPEVGADLEEEEEEQILVPNHSLFSQISEQRGPGREVGATSRKLSSEISAGDAARARTALADLQSMGELHVAVGVISSHLPGILASDIAKNPGGYIDMAVCQYKLPSSPTHSRRSTRSSFGGLLSPALLEDDDLQVPRPVWSPAKRRSVPTVSTTLPMTGVTRQPLHKSFVAVGRGGDSSHKTFSSVRGVDPSLLV